jgi:hypothetical protein
MTNQAINNKHRVSSISTGRLSAEHQVSSIELDKLVPHPDNPNRMSKADFAKLVSNIERTSRYEPLIVRPYPDTRGTMEDGRGTRHEERDTSQNFQIINGAHRWQALAKLGYKHAHCIIWDIDDQATDILLATLNRLHGRDQLNKKVKLLARLNKKLSAKDLGKLLPQTAKQIQQLTSMLSSKQLMLDESKSQTENRKSKIFATPMIFFVNEAQQQVIEAALSLAQENIKTTVPATPDGEDSYQLPITNHQLPTTRAAKRAAGLTLIAQCYLNQIQAKAARDELDRYFRNYSKPKGSTTRNVKTKDKSKYRNPK